MVRLFLFLISLSPALKRASWRWWYERLAAFYKKPDWRFMNYGYAPLKGEKSLDLDPRDEENRLHIQLYSHVLENLNLSHKQVLEVGSGRGGGCDFVARYLHPKKVIGVDFSKNAIQISKLFYNVSNIDFIEGSSEDLPFDSQVFDVVYNVESSHCYGNMAAFVDEVVRTLKPGGIFCWADLRTPEEMELCEQIFKSFPFKILIKEEITANVLKALELNSDLKETAIRKRAPRWVINCFFEFAGVKNSRIFQAFKEGRVKYWHYRLMKEI